LTGSVAVGNAALTATCACVKVKNGAPIVPALASLPLVATK